MTYYYHKHIYADISEVIIWLKVKTRCYYIIRKEVKSIGNINVLSYRFVM